jgi:hypothetical protein
MNFMKSHVQIGLFSRKTRNLTISVPDAFGVSVCMSSQMLWHADIGLQSQFCTTATSLIAGTQLEPFNGDRESPSTRVVAVLMLASECSRHLSMRHCRTKPEVFVGFMFLICNNVSSRRNGSESQDEVPVRQKFQFKFGS